MNHRVNICNKIRILKDKANYAHVVKGEILEVSSLENNYELLEVSPGRFFTVQGWFFDNNNFDNGEIELVEEVTVQPFVCSSNLSTFEHARLSFMRNQAKKGEWVWFGSGDVEIFDKILGKEPKEGSNPPPDEL